MTPFTLDVLEFVSAVVSLAFAIWFLRASRQGTGKGRAMTVRAVGGFLAVAGPLIAAPTGLECGSNCHWQFFAIGVGAGTCCGMWLARGRLRRWDGELQRAGELSRGAGRGLPWPLVGILLLATVGIGLWMPGTELSMPGLVVAAQVGSGALCGVSLSYGSQLWLWARRKEREGYGSLPYPRTWGSGP